MAAKRCHDVAGSHRGACGQNAYGFKVSDGEHFRSVSFNQKDCGNIDGGYVLQGIVGGYNAPDNVLQPVTTHWSCTLSSIVELTVALNCWSPAVSEE
jgi:hypothetical protein